MLIAYAQQSVYQTQPTPGVVIQSCLFQLFGLSRTEWDEYPMFTPIDDVVNGEVEYRGSYGVCDSEENLLAVYPELLLPGREFTVSMTPIHKSEEERCGGWRWHKWGAYIGNQEPTCEYIAEEELIDLVYCFHIYEKLPVSAA